MNAETKIKDFVIKLIAEGEELVATQWQPSGNWISAPPTYVDLELFRQWQGRCRLLIVMLGALAEPWKDMLAADTTNSLEAALNISGSLKGIRQSLEEGLLVRLENLFLAEAFSDLYDQADYLFTQGYFLASGVIARAVLEERLRHVCNSHACTPKKERPTLSDYNASLYKQTVYDKITFKHVDALSAIGNDAAHNKPELKREDVRRMLDGLRDFLLRFSV